MWFRETVFSDRTANIYHWVSTVSITYRAMPFDFIDSFFVFKQGIQVESRGKTLRTIFETLSAVWQNWPSRTASLPQPGNKIVYSSEWERIITALIASHCAAARRQHADSDNQNIKYFISWAPVTCVTLRRDWSWKYTKYLPKIF